MKHCMIVDDSDIIRKVARHYLERLGYSVSEASDGEEALTRAENHMPDIVLMDWHLPGTHVHDAIDQLRRIPGGRDAFVVYMTTEHNETDLANARIVGINDVLMKPFDRTSFEAKMHEVAYFG